MEASPSALVAIYFSRRLVKAGCEKPLEGTKQIPSNVYANRLHPALSYARHTVSASRPARISPPPTRNGRFNRPQQDGLIKHTEVERRFREPGIKIARATGNPLNRSMLFPVRGDILSPATPAEPSTAPASTMRNSTSGGVAAASAHQKLQWKLGSADAVARPVGHADQPSC